MFAVHCPRHGARVLLSERRIRAVHNTGEGIVLEVECYDGQRIQLVTGRAVTDAGPARVPAARRLVTGVLETGVFAPPAEVPEPRVAS